MSECPHIPPGITPCPWCEIERLRALLRELKQAGAVSNWLRVTDDLRQRIDAALAADQPSVSLRCQSEASVILRSIRGDIEAAYNGLDYLTSIHVATAADPNGGRQLAIDAAEIKGRLLQHMKRIDAAGDQLVAGQPERCCLDYPRCDCNSPPEPDNALACGHPSSLLLRSAETGEALYCELCDDKSGRRDAEQCETELRAEVERLKTALKTVGDDYPGSSCQQWCYEAAGIRAPTLQPCGHPWKAQHDFKCILCSSPTPP